MHAPEANFALHVNCIGTNGLLFFLLGPVTASVSLTSYGSWDVTPQPYKEGWIIIIIF